MLGDARGTPWSLHRPAPLPAQCGQGGCSHWGGAEPWGLERCGFLGPRENTLNNGKGKQNFFEQLNSAAAPRACLIWPSRDRAREHGLSGASPVPVLASLGRFWGWGGTPGQG